MSTTKRLSPLLLFCLLSACANGIEELAKLTPSAAAEMSDKQICERVSWYRGGWYKKEKFSSFSNEVDRRGLSHNQCCYKRITDTPARCRGQVVGEKGINETFSPSDSVALILDKSKVKRPYITIGTLYDIWEENTGTGAVLASDIGLLVQKQLTSSEYNARSLSIQFVEERFEQRYKERARQVGADALIVTIADRRKFESPLILGTTATTTHKGVKMRLYFDVIKYTD